MAHPLPFLSTLTLTPQPLLTGLQLSVHVQHRALTTFCENIHPKNEMFTSQHPAL